MNTPHLSPPFLLSMPGGSEWLIIILVVLILFGAKKIPELAKGLGKGMRDFQDAKNGMEKEENSGIGKDNTESASR